MFGLVASKEGKRLVGGRVVPVSVSSLALAEATGPGTSLLGRQLALLGGHEVAHLAVFVVIPGPALNLSLAEGVALEDAGGGVSLEGLCHVDITTLEPVKRGMRSKVWVSVLEGWA